MKDLVSTSFKRMSFDRIPSVCKGLVFSIVSVSKLALRREQGMASKDEPFEPMLLSLLLSRVCDEEGEVRAELRVLASVWGA